MVDGIIVAAAMDDVTMPRPQHPFPVASATHCLTDFAHKYETCTLPGSHDVSSHGNSSRISLYYLNSSGRMVAPIELERNSTANFAHYVVVGAIMRLKTTVLSYHSVTLCFIGGTGNRWL